jgi:hypothetical protein
MASTAFGSGAATFGALVLLVRATVIDNTPVGKTRRTPFGSAVSKPFLPRLNFDGRRRRAGRGDPF